MRGDVVRDGRIRAVMTEKQWMRAAVALLTLGMVAIGSRVSWVRADGIPTPTPLTYSGTLTEGGVPVNDTRFIELALWDHESDTDPSHRTRCAVPSTSVRVEQGRFQVVLPEACSAVIHDTRNLWVDIRVSGAPLGRTKIGAVPFAVEAERSGGLTAAAANALMPTGSVVAFAGRPDRVPSGWLLCDGRSLARSEHPALFDAIGTAHGGDGTMFNLPDYRGRFLRGVDSGMGRDLDRAGRAEANAGGNRGDAVGSVQGGATAMPNAAFVNGNAGMHAHGGMTSPVSGDRSTNPARDYPPSTGSLRAFAYYFSASGGDNFFMDHVHAISPDGAHTHAISGGDRETRPVNAYVNYIIKL